MTVIKEFDKVSKRINSANDRVDDLIRQSEAANEALAKIKDTLYKNNEACRANKRSYDLAQSSLNAAQEKVLKSERRLEDFKNTLPNRLKKNKKLAIGVAAGTTALGALGAYGYYKNKNKKQ